MEEQRIYNTVVIGGGMSGLSALDRLNTTSTNNLLLEREAHVGGRASSVPYKSISLDNGAAFILPTYKRILELADKYNVELTPLPSELKVSLFHENTLFKFPTNLIEFYRSDLFTLVSKLRITLGGMLLPLILLSRKSDDLKSLSKLILGRDFTEKILDPISFNLFGYDSSRFTVRGFLKLLPYLKKKKFFTFKNGIGELSEAIARGNSDSIRVQHEVVEIKPYDSQYRLLVKNLNTQTEYELFANQIVIATTAGVGAQLLTSINPDVAEQLSKVSYSQYTKIFLKVDYSEKLKDIHRVFFTKESIIRSFNYICEIEGGDIISLGCDGILGEAEIKELSLLREFFEDYEVIHYKNWKEALPEFEKGIKSNVAAGIELVGDYIGGPFLEGAAGNKF